MIDRFSQLPRALAERTRMMRLAGVPAIVAHPDWRTPAPMMIWMHGRTANKELDPGRYLRWVRAGIAAVALDLPGHGERTDVQLQEAGRTLEAVQQMVGELDYVVEAIAEMPEAELFDLDRTGCGGMSAGGMAALRRLCEGHDFACAAIEGTTGSVRDLYFPTAAGAHAPWRAKASEVLADELDAASRLSGFRPIPLLALHTTTDRVVPIENLTGFLGLLGAEYERKGVSPSLIELRTFSHTGAPEEHAGFGKFGNDAKNAQVEFLVRQLSPIAPQPAT